MRIRCLLANSAWLGTAIPDWHRFRRALGQPSIAQQGVLKEIKDACSGTAVLESNFNDIEPRDWVDIEPLIDRAAGGEQGVISRERISHFEPTSGSAAAKKLIPSTPLQRKQFNRAIHAWVADLYLNNPGLLGGPSYWSISPAVSHESTSGGIPVGYEDDSEYLGRLGKWLVNWTLAVPAGVRKLNNDDFMRATILFLLSHAELRLISVWNPTYLTSLITYFDHHQEQLWSELEAGVVICGRKLQRNRSDNPWPKLKLISCWADGHAATQVGGLQQWFPDTQIQPKGLISTEAFISLPFRGEKVLAVTSHYLEFETDEGRLITIEELREGDEVTVVVTTGGGLIRYRLDDRIMVTGFCERTPCIDFLGRESIVSDLCGEKLSDAFVCSVINELEIQGFSLLVPDGDGYTLYTTAGVDAKKLDEKLSANFQYAWALRIGQLQPVKVVLVPETAEDVYMDVCESRGRKRGDIKPVALDTWNGWHHLLPNSHNP
jgi:hypothetical protein